MIHDRDTFEDRNIGGGFGTPETNAQRSWKHAASLAGAVLLLTGFFGYIAWVVFVGGAK